MHKRETVKTYLNRVNFKPFFLSKVLPACRVVMVKKMNQRKREKGEILTLILGPMYSNFSSGDQQLDRALSQIGPSAHKRIHVVLDKVTATMTGNVGVG